MKKQVKNKLKQFVFINITLILVISIVSYRNVFEQSVLLIAQKFGTASAYSFFPQAIFYIPKATDQVNQLENKQPKTKIKPQETTTKSTEPTTQKAVGAVSNAAGKVLVQTITRSSATASYGDIFIKNSSGVSIDIKEQLKKKLDLNIYKNKTPQVLIYHTHATECYFPQDSKTFSKSWPSRTSDSKQNMIAVGEILSSELNKAGITTIHDKTLHDKDSYTGSYDSSREAIKKYLKKYPSIDVVLDLHRDAITSSNGDKLKPTVTINGKKAAQIMLIAGCESGGITNYPNWKENFRFGINLQQKLEKQHPSLARPLFFASKKYNQDLSPNAVLVEMGSQANTLDEAKYSAKLLSESLISLLEDYEK